jgi:hypothetical protein
MYFSDSFFNSDTEMENSCCTHSISSISESETESDHEEPDALLDKLKDVRDRHRSNAVIAYLNINSYRYKSGDIISLLNKNYIDVMCVAETKLDSAFSEEQFQAQNYTMFRRDGSTS